MSHSRPSLGVTYRIALWRCSPLYQSAKRATERCAAGCWRTAYARSGLENLDAFPGNTQPKSPTGSGCVAAAQRCCMKASIALRTRQELRTIFSRPMRRFARASRISILEPGIMPIAGICDLDNLAILERQP
jgi:hypothetical protein